MRRRTSSATAAPLKVGFIGLCIRTPLIKSNQAGIRFIDPMAAAARYIPILKQRGANVIVAITHLGFDEDRALVRRFPEIDLVIGGHEHIPIDGHGEPRAHQQGRVRGEVCRAARRESNRRAERSSDSTS